MATAAPAFAFSFTTVEFERLFPFFVLVAPTGDIVAAGRSIRSLSAGVRSGAQFFDAFALRNPETPFTLDRLRMDCGQLYSIREKSRGTLFRGQFQRAGDGLVFVGSPWFGEIAELEPLGLASGDFAPHDPTLDLLQLLQIQKDVSGDLRGLTKRLASQAAELEAAAHTKDAFLASMSHELRTPLTGILGLSEALLEGSTGPVNQQQARYLEIIKSSGGRLLALVNDILDLVRISSGREQLVKYTCSVAEICAASMEAVHPLAAKRRQRVTFDEQTGGANIQADGRRLKQAIDHLLNNASKFTSEGGEFGLRTFARDGAIHFEIWDQGVGIAAPDLSRLFQPFAQLDTRLSRRYTGVGLGLALTKLLVELHGGRIDVSSTPDLGSRFTITLSQECADEKRVAPAPTGRSSAAG